MNLCSKQHASPWQSPSSSLRASKRVPRPLLPLSGGPGMSIHPRKVALRKVANGDHVPITFSDSKAQEGLDHEQQQLLAKDANGRPPSAASGHTSEAEGAKSEAGLNSPTTLQRLTQIAAPIMFQNVVGFANCMISMAYVGGIGPVELSAYVLACSVYNVSGLSVALGLSTGMDTLAGSAFGAKEYGKLGSILQRAIMVCWAACVPLAAAWLNSEPLLLMLGQEAQIAKLAARFLIVWTPCLFLNVMTECFRRFLQAQSVVKPMAVTGALSVLLAPLWYHLFMTVWGMGLDGSAYAFIASQVTTLLGLFAYLIYRTIRLDGKPEQAWTGFDLKAALTGWSEYLQFGIPAAVMICLEWWVFEAVVIMSGWMPNAGTCLACMGILVNINAWCYMLPLGLAAGVNTLVANALGAGNAHNAARVFSTGIKTGAGLQFSIAVAALTAGPALIRVLCQDPAVQSMASAALPVLSCVMVLDGMNAVVAGVLRGAGRQRLGAIVNGAACALAIPAAWAIAFKLNLGVPGAWMGVGLGAALQLSVLLTILTRAKGGHKSRSPVTLDPPPTNDQDSSSDSSGSETPGGTHKRADKVPQKQPAAWDWDWDAEAQRVRRSLATA